MWDLRTQRCIQTLQDRHVYAPDDKVAVMAYEPGRRRLVTGTYQLRQWPLADTAATQGVGHVHPVTCMLYNPMLNEVGCSMYVSCRERNLLRVCCYKFCCYVSTALQIAVRGVLCCTASFLDTQVSGMR